MLGLVNAKNIDKRGHDGYDGSGEQCCDDDTKEQLRYHMQGVGGKLPVVHPPCAHHQQDGCQRISKYKTVSP